MKNRKEDFLTIQNEIEVLSNKLVSIEGKISQIDKSKEFDYQKILSTIKYLYKYYDDMNRDKQIDITSMLQ